MESPHPKSAERPLLAKWELAVIDVFVSAAGLIGLPRSIGEIYGLLFCEKKPVTFDEIGERLVISRGSISQGLKVLRQIGAVKVSHTAESRKDYYQPELSIRRLIGGFIRDQFNPHLESGLNRLKQIDSLIDDSLSPVDRQHAHQRLTTLHTWHTRTQKLFPIIVAVLGGARSFQSDKQEVDRIIV